MTAPGGTTLPTERQIQRAILKMAAVCFPDVLLHHSPGGAHLAGSATSRFKQMGALKGDGLRPGFPDLICIWGEGRVAFMEVKRPKLGKLSEEQAKLHMRLHMMCHDYAVVRSVEDAHAFLKGCGAPCRGDM